MVATSLNFDSKSLTPKWYQLKSNSGVPTFEYTSRRGISNISVAQKNSEKIENLLEFVRKLAKRFSKL